jgi:hypothetical protein
MSPAIAQKDHPMKLHRIAALLAFSVSAALPLAHAADTPAAALAEACKQDVQTLCPGVKPGEGRVAACLKSNRSKISDACKSAIKAERKNKAAN